MKHIGLKIALVMIVSLTVCCSIFLFVFHISFSKYFEGEAQKEIALLQGFYKLDLSTLTEEDYFNYFYDDNNIYASSVNYLYTNNNYELYADYYDWANVSNAGADKTVAEFAKNNAAKLSLGEIMVRQSASSHYVIGQLPSYDESICVVYIDITSMDRLANRFSVIAIIPMTIISIIMVFVGMNFGKRLEIARARQTTFFQNASHELKTPLMSIQGYAEGIQTGVIEPGKAATVIMDESLRMSGLVEELLDISKIESSQMKLDLEPFDLKELIYDCLRSLEPVAAKKNINLNVDFPDERIILTGDEVQIRRAISNLLTNALRYAQSSVDVAIKQGISQTIISVLDDGDHLPKDVLSHIFERFYTGPNGNTGIGLALSKEIIELHKGTITAANVASGIEFKINLPFSTTKTYF
ncbi:MAG: HAMP domain-containing histidine kinase [Lachnospiraceae bacterium]|nr:HAMP domain-containing histidine kinase [Lachnospiraceae bacterium]